MTLKDVRGSIVPLDEAAQRAARLHWSRVAKPLDSMGTLEDILVQIAGITGSDQINLEKKAVAVFCADNGVIEERVTQCGGEVTGVVARAMARGTTPVCRMAAVAGAEVFPVDIGLRAEQNVPGLLQKNVRRGTANLARGPAMTREEAEQALFIGVELAKTLCRKGYRLLAAGEMGIGNTTTSAAMAAVLLGAAPEDVTGRGAGLSTEGWNRKVAAVRRGITWNRPAPEDPLDVLSKVGGLDIAGMAGFYLGGALCRVPVVLDGVISLVAALTAVRLCPAARGYLIPSHRPEEPAGRLLLLALGASPVLQAHMRLGEGTGAVALMPLLDMALAVYRDTPSFHEMDMEAYTPQR